MPPGGLREDLKLAIDEGLEVRAIDRVRAVVIMQGGETRLADYRGISADRTWDTESVTKSILSILVGRAVDEGLVSLDQTQDELLPEHVGAMARWQRRHAARADDAHGWVLGRGPGHVEPDAEPELVEIMLGRAQRESRGKFLYSNEGSHVIEEYLAGGFTWPVDSAGTHLGWGLLMLTPQPGPNLHRPPQRVG